MQLGFVPHRMRTDIFEMFYGATYIGPEVCKKLLHTIFNIYSTHKYFLLVYVMQLQNKIKNSERHLTHNINWVRLQKLDKILLSLQNVVKVLCIRRYAISVYRSGKNFL